MNRLLSVCLITYNHINYIEQAIEGVLMQKANFSWELIIADDCSTDGTREIVKTYQEKYPGFIKLILQKKNVGAAKNCIDLISYPNSKYIAYFEGDDYWTDPYKLQKQVDFLEANPKIVGCFSDTLMVNDEGILIGNAISETYKAEININHLITFWMPTVSVCLKGNHVKNILKSKRIEKVNNGDMFIYLTMGQFGNFSYVKTEANYYRKHLGGIWSTLKVISQYEKNLVSDYIIYDELMPQFKNVLIQRIKNNYDWQLNYFRENEHITYIYKFLKKNLPELLKRKLFKESFRLMMITIPILKHRITAKSKRIFQH